MYSSHGFPKNNVEEERAQDVKEVKSNKLRAPVKMMTGVNEESLLRARVGERGEKCEFGREA